MYVAWTDFHEHRIPNFVTLPMFLVGLIYAGFSGHVAQSLVGAGCLFGVGLILFIMGGMGGGDIKLMAAIGVWVGLYVGLFVLFLASLVAIVWWLGKKIKPFFNRGQETVLIKDALPINAIPFGTCLAASTWAMFLVGGLFG